ncbi:MAG: hypothetical protein ACTHU0_16175 [Kofleriaceae bacterium]
MIPCWEWLPSPIGQGPLRSARGHPHRPRPTGRPTSRHLLDEAARIYGADDVTTGMGGGSPEAAWNVMGHWAEPTTGLALMEDGPDAGLPTTAPGSGSPAPSVPSQDATWEGQKDPKARQNYDLEWMDGLNPEVRRSIHHAHGANKKLDGQKRALEKKRARAKQSAKTDAARQKIDQDYDAKIVQLDQQIEADLDVDAPVGTPKQSVTTPDTKTAAKKHSQRRTETDFMAWATNVFGKGAKDPTEVAERIKKHYLGIKPVPGQDGMLLAEKARDRYLKARQQFEAENPGYTLPSSGSTMSLRKHHQDEQGMGKQGHAIGASIDFDAFHNPNLNPDSPKTNALINDYMIKKFGKAAPGFQPLTRMPTKASDFERIGKHSNAKLAGKDKNAVTPADEAVLSNVEASWNRMAQTSANFQAALPPENLTLLKTARNAHFDLQKKEEALKQVSRQLERARGDKEKEKQLLKEEAQLERDVKALKIQQTQGLRKGFEPWRTTLEQEDSIADLTNKTDGAAMQLWASGRKELAAMTSQQLADYAARAGLTSEADFNTKQKRPPKQGAYKKQLVEEIKKKEAELKNEISYRERERKVRDLLLERIGDSKIVFGAGEFQKADKTWKTQKKVSDPSIMQLIEHGFVTNDAMPKVETDQNGAPIDPATKQVGRRKGVMNAKSAAMLARWGFAPSNFGDNQHFDHVETYRDVREGGYSLENINTKLSPEQKWTPAQPAPATPSTTEEP